ncbi:MAG: hypothetical protein JWR19_2203 [Pedosphaera sp.]|nr:hypothetical protein [Pedosphaera sp.]
MKKLSLEKYYVTSLERLVEQANQDTDAASIFFLGDCIKRADGAVIIVKGHDEAVKAHKLLSDHGLNTAGKPVVGKNRKKQP